MKNSFRFFNNTDCKYFPCHKVDNPEQFNCLFCYCPLYALGDKCGGNFEYFKEKHIKMCDNCNLPHNPDYYEIIIEKLKEMCKN